MIEGAVNLGGDRQDEGKWTRDGKPLQGFRSWKEAPNLKRRKMEWVQSVCCEGEREEEGEVVAEGGGCPLGCDRVTATSPGGRVPGSGTF